MIRIDYDRCLGCGLCEDSCLSGAIKIEDERPTVHEGCIYCGSCVSVCPAEAICMDVKQKEQMNMQEYSGVWVVLENDVNTNMPKKVSYELLSQARKLADQLGEEVTAVNLCKKAENQLYNNLKDVGCDQLILAEHEALEQYSTELYSTIVTNLIRQYKPSGILLPGTENGRDLAPRVSARLGVGLTADCTDLTINEKKELVQIRPTYGGNIIASIVTPNHRPQMATVRPNVFCVSKCKESHELRIIKPIITIDTNIIRVKRTGFKPKEFRYRDVTEADIVIIGGYGVGKEEFPLLYELADKLDAAVGATRKVVDEGWAPLEIQIGQTGKIVAPEVCICFGVSGSLQHTIGIRGSRKIIAVNSDPTAQIFGISDVAILGDCRPIIRQMLKKCEIK